ncbi:branched-chain amino acid ABC transporter permease [Paraburkholderia hospita]|uniref:Branched-chain amino acid ABC transporter permease n=1 Tax=Paraburkholderia hospita TaxID=169430 RepID=A0AAN1MQY5_9BURK|nr:branched-chain amino acid ABC transporter permease [Paraburkholderia hospita]AUT76270.1 branched-chain amino acid ABC transporter permease [Paraburkholderia hospita]
MMQTRSSPFGISVGLPWLLFVILIVVPFLAHATEQTFYETLIARVIIYAIVATALNLALGYGGLVSFGHALFFGLGGYSVALPAFYGIDNGWIHLLICILGCGLAGVVTGAISLRTVGVSFIMITLAFAQMGYFVFVSLKQYGGDDGTTISATSKFFGFDLGHPDNVYACSLVVLALATYWMVRLRVSPFGMVLRATRQNARRVNAVGLPGKAYLLCAYVISAILSGVAGLLMANLNAFASPASMSWVVSGDTIAMVVLGGLGSAYGGMLGAIAFLGMEELLKGFTDHWMAVFGPAIVLMALLGKTGIAGFLEGFDARFSRKQTPRQTPPESGEPAKIGEGS